MNRVRFHNLDTTGTDGPGKIQRRWEARLAEAKKVGKTASKKAKAERLQLKAIRIEAKRSDAARSSPLRRFGVTRARRPLR